MAHLESLDITGLNGHPNPASQGALYGSMTEPGRRDGSVILEPTTPARSMCIGTPCAGCMA